MMTGSTHALSASLRAPRAMRSNAQVVSYLSYTKRKTCVRLSLRAKNTERDRGQPANGKEQRRKLERADGVAAEPAVEERTENHCADELRHDKEEVMDTHVHAHLARGRCAGDDGVR